VAQFLFANNGLSPHSPLARKAKAERLRLSPGLFFLAVAMVFAFALSAVQSRIST
jgi:hypothetical protein